MTEIVDLLPVAVCVVDPDGRFLFVSAEFERIFGYTRDEVLGRRTFELVHPEDIASTLQQATAVMAGASQRHFRNRYIHKSGHYLDIQWSAQWSPEFGVRIAVAQEVTDLRRTERELERLASHDLLTGLPNRLRLQQSIESALVHANRVGGGLALLYLDLDGFKEVNDHRGHETGDRLLREVATRLKDGIRLGDLVARVGGDEFVVLLTGCPDVATAANVAKSLRTQIRQPYAFLDDTLHLDASIGVACFPQHGGDSETLLAHADREMYAYKSLHAVKAGDRSRVVI
ncbi:MAG: sensor domain-containing diguanylate cyclase [Pseudomonadota bacterium]|nr:sensor domain-containing diguanylate cyclase [Pseudomonadota bacterium]